MNYTNPYRKSLADRIAASRPEDLILMMHEGLIVRIKQAQSADDPNAVRTKEILVQASSIATSLIEALNFEDGGDTARNLEKLYGFVVDELVRATQGKDRTSALDNALKISETLHEGWQGLCGKAAETFPGKAAGIAQ